MAILDDFHEIAALAGGEAIGSPIVEDEEIDLDQHAEQAREAAVAVGEIKIGEQARHAGVALDYEYRLIVLGKHVELALRSILADLDRKITIKIQFLEAHAVEKRPHVIFKLPVDWLVFSKTNRLYVGANRRATRRPPPH